MFLKKFLMTRKNVKYNYNTSYIGVNGYGICLGINISDWDDKDSDLRITIQNTRGNSNSCCIELPKSNVEDLINALKTFLNDSSTTK